MSNQHIDEIYKFFVNMPLNIDGICRYFNKSNIGEYNKYIDEVIEEINGEEIFTIKALPQYISKPCYDKLKSGKSAYVLLRCRAAYGFDDLQKIPSYSSFDKVLCSIITVDLMSNFSSSFIRNDKANIKSMQILYYLASKGEFCYKQKGCSLVYNFIKSFL